jgi:hypothetical protein
MQKQREGESVGDNKRERVLAQSTRLSMDYPKKPVHEPNIIEVFKYYKLAFGG